MAGWSKTQGKLSKTNNNLKTEIMSKAKEDKTAKTPETTSKKKVVIKKKAPKAEAKAAPKADKKVAAKPAKKAAKKAEKKTPGVIASILEFISGAPIKEKDVLKKLVKRFPKREADSMAKTIKAQIGSNKQPVRMEREQIAKGNKSFKLVVAVNEKTKEKTFSLKK